MEENNNIFLAGGDALLYLAEPMHKKVFVWGHPLSTYLSYDFFNSLPLWAPAYILDEIQCFELGIFSFNSYVYYPTRDFNFRTRAFSVLTREFELVTPRFELVIRGFELVTRRVKLVTCNS